MSRALEIDCAFRVGDMQALRDALDDPGVIPNGVLPHAMGSCLTYAVYHSPVAFIRELLELGADPSPEHDDGFPPLIAALWQPSRRDTNDVVRVLLAFGADPNQRGHNDYGPLHVAAVEGNVEAARMLLEAGADPDVRTRIDDHETPAELAARKGDDRMSSLLAT